MEFIILACKIHNVGLKTRSFGVGLWYYLKFGPSFKTLVFMIYTYP